MFNPTRLTGKLSSYVQDVSMIGAPEFRVKRKGLALYGMMMFQQSSLFSISESPHFLLRIINREFSFFSPLSITGISLKRG